MDDKKSNNGGHGTKWTTVLVACVGAFVGSSGTVALVFNSPRGQEIARPDPFTGTQAATLRTGLHDLQVDFSSHVRQPPDNRDHDLRITTLEVQFDQILSNQVRILERLDRLNGQ